MVTYFPILLIKKNIFQIFISLIITITTIKSEDQCPKEFPIYNTIKQNCSLEYCTDEQFLNETCIIANSYTKTRWIDKKTVIGESNSSQIYPTVGWDEEENLLFETTIGKNTKIFMSLDKNGIPYKKDLLRYELKKAGNDKFLYNMYPKSILTTIDSHRIFFSLSAQESIGIFDLDEKTYTEKILEDVLGYKIKSNINSLLKTKDTNIYIYCYITFENRLAMQKIKFKKNDIDIIKTLIEEKKTIPRKSRKCEIFIYNNNEYIECIDMDINQVYYVRIYNSELYFINEYKLDKNLAPIERAYYSYNDIYYISLGRSVFFTFNDIPEKGTKLIYYWKSFNGKDLNNIVTSQERYELFKDFDYYFSDVDNGIASLEEGYLVLASMTLYGNKHLFIILFDIVKADLIIMYYLDIPLKELYNINFYSHLYVFPYGGRFGIGFVEEINDSNNIKYQSSFMLFNFANSTDPEPVYNIFSFYNKINDTLYTLRTLDYFNIQNNLFCYSIKGFRFIEYPKPETGIEILITDRNKAIKNIENYDNENGFAEIITISYSKELNEIQKGNYKIVFVPILREIEKDVFLQSLSKNEKFIGNDIPLNWNPSTYEGRNIQFKFSVGNCHQNCLTCDEESADDLNQKCKQCLSGYYFQENTKNCLNYTPPGYFFDSVNKIYSQCHSECATCNAKSNGQIQNCLSCNNKNYILYNSTNCLNCRINNLYVEYNQVSCRRYIPEGYYLNNSELNTIDKCYQSCYSCNKGPDFDNNNMNCIYCRENFYPVEGTNNCESENYEGYYLDNDLKLKKCHKYCKTCKKGGTDDKMNCESCDNKLGFFYNESNSNCEFKAIDNYYYVPENESYLPCYEKCLTCYDKEIITQNDNNDKFMMMNCISCNETEGYFLFTKNGNNCLNCKAENKYVNYEETNCTDIIPEGYFLSNRETNQIDICYYQCKTCIEKGYSDYDMKCSSCFAEQGYFLLKGNCIKSMTCDKYFYYKSNLEQNTYITMEKICLDKKEECPDILPFYFTTNNECINICDLESIFGEGCKISNFDKGLFQLINLIKNEYKVEGFENFFSYINSNDRNEIYIIKIKLFDYEVNKNYSDSSDMKLINLEENIKRLDNEGYLNIQKNSIFIEKEISHLNECLQLLGYDNTTDKLRMLRIDINNLNATFNDFYFQLYDPSNNYEIINTSLCNDISYNVNRNLEQLVSQKLSEINADESNNKYLNKQYNSDKCIATYDEYGADLLIEDRIQIYNEIINEYNKNKIDDNEASYKIILYPYEMCPLHCDVINFNDKNYNTNCSCHIINHYINSIDNFMIIQNNNDSNYHSNDTYTIIIAKESENNNIVEINTDKLMIESNANIKYMKCINSISKQFKHNYVLIIMTILDLLYLLTTLLYCFHYRKIYIEPLNDKKNIIIKNIKGLKSSYTYRIGGNPPPKSRDLKFQKNMFSSVNSDFQSINNENNNNNINKKYVINKQINKIHYIKNSNNFDELTLRNNNKAYYYKNNKQKNEGIDYDLEEYKIVLAKDKRSCIDIFCSLTKKKHIFILIFSKDDFIPVLKITLFIFCLINYFTTNVFLFTDKVIHQIYLDKGDYNSNYQAKNIFLAAFISSVFLWVSKIIFLVKKSDKNMLYNIKFVDLFYFIFLLLIIFYWIYVGSYTSVFIKSQKHLSFNFLLTILVCILYEFILTIISLIFRLIAVKNGNNPLLYKISVGLILLKG